ncbi:MAG TPA: thioredoxin [Ornithinicoccus sp.]|jgi:thioredoxin 1|nr:thioredoxin [Ornithinicoccus sp.]
MSTVDLTAETFEQTITDNDIVLVDWWASWCGPCKMFAPVYEEVAAANPDVVFGKIDTDAEQALSQGVGITSIPTLMAFRDGILLFAQAGALPKAALEDVLSQVRALDMDEVRRQVAAQEQAGAAQDG